MRGSTSYIALLSLPFIIAAQRNIYARYAEPDPYADAYPYALADAESYPYAEIIDSYYHKRDAYAHTLAEAESDPYAETIHGHYHRRDAFPYSFANDADAKASELHERYASPSPMAPTLTNDQKDGIWDEIRTMTGQYKNAQKEYDRAVRSYNSANGNDAKKTAAEEARDFAKAEADIRGAVSKKYKLLGEADPGDHKGAKKHARENQQKWQRILKSLG